MLVDITRGKTMFPKSCFWLVVLGAALPALAPLKALAQSGGSDLVISTDRPSVANSSTVVPKGIFQVENGFLVTRLQGQTILDLPESSVRFGLLKRTELRLAVPDYFDTVGGSPSGFGDSAVGVKQQLGPIHSLNLSVIFFLSLPTGAQSISSHGYDPGLQFPWSRSLSANWTASGQAAFYWPTQAGSHNFTGEATFVLDRQLTKPWDTFVEYAGDFPERGGSRQILHFGSSYKLAPRHQIDFQVAAGLSNSAPDYFIGAGYSFFFRVAK